MTVVLPEVLPSRRSTREEYSALPEGPPLYELINGGA